MLTMSQWSAQHVSRGVHRTFFFSFINPACPLVHSLRGDQSCPHCCLHLPAIFSKEIDSVLKKKHINKSFSVLMFDFVVFLFLQRMWVLAPPRCPSLWRSNSSGWRWSFNVLRMLSVRLWWRVMTRILQSAVPSVYSWRWTPQWLFIINMIWMIFRW